MDIDRRSSRNSPVVTVLLVVVVVAAAYFRFTGLNWDNNQHQHPDERFLTMVETGLQPIGAPPERLGAPPVGRAQLRDCEAWGGYFDTACSPLNPVNRGYGYYVYGTLPIFLVRYAGEVLNELPGKQPGVDWTSYDRIHLVGRALSGLADIITLLLLFAIASRLYDEKVGLLAAGLFAAAVLPIQQSHFFTVDNFLVMFAAGTFYFAVRAQQDGQWIDFAAAGILLGAAAACKISAWPLAGIVTLASILWWSGGQRRPIESALFKLALAGVLAMLAFRIFQPYAFAGPNIWNISLDAGWRSTMESIQKLINGEQDAPFAHMWTQRAPIVFPWINMVVWGMGLPLGLAAWAGWALVGVRIARRQDWRTHLLAWLWATGFFIYQTTQWTKSIRYLLPVYPIFILLAAYGLGQVQAECSRLKVKGLKLNAKKALGIGLTAIVLLGSLAWAWGYTRIYARPLTRVTASQWIYQNVPTAVTLRYQAAAGEQVLQLAAPREVTFTDNAPVPINFQVPVTGTLTSVTLNKLLDPASDGDVESLRVSIGDNAFGQNPLAQAELSVHLELAPREGGSYLLQFSPVALYPGHSYYVTVQATQGGPVLARSSAVGNEHWDDAIPVRLEGRDGFSIYRGVEFQNYNEDDDNKRINLLNWLEQADFINLTSNRLYGGIPRLPTRYPMTTEYYRALFSGQLGFEKAAEFTSYITIGPFVFPDQESTEMLGLPNPFDRAPGSIPIFLPPAEETFSVYDHPRVLIYSKQPGFSFEKVAQILGQFDLSQTIRLWPKQATAAPTALGLDPGVWDEQQQSSTWSQLYDRSSLLNRFPLLAICSSWLLLAVLGGLAWPLVALAWPALPDRGWGLARTLGLLIVGYLAWLAASLRVMTFGRGTLLAAGLVLAAAGAWAAWARRRQLVDFVRQAWRLILLEEAVLALTMAIFLLIRYGNGDLWHFYMGGERPMDFAYLNAVLKSIYFPPYDPWYAGGQMSYYYFGFVLLSVPIKLLGIVPAIAYNIVLPLLAALTAVGAFSVAFNISDLGSRASDFRSPIAGRRSPISVGLLAVLFVVFLGNLGELKVIFDGLAQIGTSTFRSTIPGLAYTIDWLSGLAAMAGGQAFPARLDWWYWNASRIMSNGEINEFPFFTFLYGDLHAHMIAFPLTLALLGLGVGWTQRQRWNTLDAAVSVLLGALVVGVARANNTWDYPTYLAIAFIALFACGLRPALNASRAGGEGEPLAADDSHSTLLAGPPVETPAVDDSQGQSLLQPAGPPVETPAVNDPGSPQPAGPPVETSAADNPQAVPGQTAPPGDLALEAAAADAQPAANPAPLTTQPIRPRPQRAPLPGALVSGILGLTLFGAAWIVGGIDDVPTFLMTAALLFVVSQLVHRLLETRTGPTSWRWIDAAYMAVMGLSVLYYCPYTEHYATAYTGVELWKGPRTPFNDYILIHGILLFPIATFLFVQVRRLGWRWFAAATAASRIWPEAIGLAALFAAAGGLGLAGLGLPIILVAGPLLVLAGLCLVRPRLPAVQRYALLLIVLALIITIAVEFIVLRGDIGRMNTVFKFYLQAWLVFGVVSAAMIGWLGQSAPRRWKPDIWLSWRTAMAALILAGLTYTLFATRARISDRFDASLGPTLDAMKFMSVAQANEQGQTYAFADEYKALLWMQDNIQGTPVVAESASAHEYRSLRNRVTTYTGLPALLGYNWHQRQQRSILPQAEVIDRRAADADLLYTTLDVTQAVRLIQRYNIGYIMAGYPERLYYPAEGLLKFEHMVTQGLLRVAYANGGVTIYEVVE